MPWCDACEHYYAPSAMTPEGHCPRCDADLLAPDDEPAGDAREVGERGDAADAGADEKVPWHFKLMVVLLVAYLGWRFWDLIAGLF